MSICCICGDEFIEKSQGIKTVCRKGSCVFEYNKWNRPPNVKCVICGKEFFLKKREIKDRNCCSIKCLNRRKSVMYQGQNNPNYLNRGANNPIFKGGKKIRKYRFIYSPEHPFARGGYVLEHRLVAEEYLLNSLNSIEIDGKKYLKEDYTVHHIDEDKLNNNVSNLKVMTRKDHTTLHNIKRQQKRDTVSGRFIK